MGGEKSAFFVTANESVAKTFAEALKSQRGIHIDKGTCAGELYAVLGNGPHDSASCYVKFNSTSKIWEVWVFALQCCGPSSPSRERFETLVALCHTYHLVLTPGKEKSEATQTQQQKAA
jgi:hypothetical protein